MVASSRWFVHIPRHAAIPMFLLASVWVFLLGRTPVQIITGIATLASIALAQYSTRLVADRSDGDDHTLWASASTALTFLFLGEYVEMLLRMGAFRTSGPASALSFLAFVAAAMFAAPALWHVARPEIVSYSSLASYAVDLLVLVLTFLLGCLTLLLPSSVDGAALPASRFIPLVLYPSLEIGIIGYALVFKRTRWRPHEIALGCALAGLGLRDTIALTTAGAMTGAPPGSFASLPADLVLVCAYGAATVAAVIRLRAVAPEVRPLAPTGPVPDPVWPSFAAPLTAMLIAPVMLLRAMTHGWSDAQLWSAVVIAMLLGISFTFRSFLLNRENARLQLMSTTDPLTGLASHRQFHEQLDNELGRASRDGTPLTVAVFDVDDFDRVNNVYGHAVGDLRLKSIADLLRADARGTDVVCRVGGDEFAIIMPNTGSHDAYAVCLRVQASLGKARDAASVPISVSVGIATVPEHAADHEELVERADGALYWAKFHGRGRVVVFDPELIRALGPEQRIALLEEESYVNMVRLLAAAVDARDPHTQRHSRNVANHALSFCRHLDIDPERFVPIETAALLHDVGRIGTPDAVLGKPGELSPEEYEIVKQQPALAVRILRAIPRQEILPWIASHHERWDGRGFPAGTAGEDIPFESRLIALCDAFDAMTSDRPHRKALDPAAACDEILREAGGQFDPVLARRFVDMVTES